MRSNLKQIRRGAAGLAVAFMLTGVSPSFVAFAQVAAPAAAALPEPAIKALQDALNRQGIAVKADGVLNEETRSAILRYQSQHHLPGTGDPDKATLDKLGVRLGTAPDQSATVAQAAPAEGPPAQAPSSPQAPAAPMPGGMMISGPMMQGMMQTMRAMMTMMEEHDAAWTDAATSGARRHDDELSHDVGSKAGRCASDDADDAGHDGDDDGDARPDAVETDAPRSGAARANAARSHTGRPHALGTTLTRTNCPARSALHEAAYYTADHSRSSM